MLVRQSRGFWSVRSLGLGLALLSMGVSCGCCRLHFTQWVRLDVVDGLTGQPAAGTEVMQMVPTGKFEAPLRSEAVTDAGGRVRFLAIVGVDRTYWMIGRDGEFNGRAPSQIPSEFDRLPSDGDDECYRVPFWRTLLIRLEIPDGFTGPVALWKTEEDVSRESGWAPPPLRGTDVTSLGTLRMGAQGSASCPSSIGGFRGVAFDPIAPVNVEGTPLPCVWRDATLKDDDPERSKRTAWWLSWRIAAGAPAPTTGTSTARLRCAWFIGTRSELDTWLLAHALRPATGKYFGKKGSAATYETLDFPKAQLLKALPPCESVPTAPSWIESPNRSN